jgi:TRAP-type C4-dicarboxylate transport system permease small subunit
MTGEIPELAQTLVGVEGQAWVGLRRLALKIDYTIGTLCEAAGAGLVLAETCILIAGVVSRYVFDRPLMWTDELANFLFLWLAMLGTVVALRRNEHMRLTTLINSLSPKRGQWLSTVGALVVIVFVLEILVPAAQYLEVQRSTELITLSISDGYRVIAILAGASLTAVIALLRLLETTSWRGFFGRARAGRGRSTRIVAGAAAADRDGSWQPRFILCRPRRRLRSDRGADRLHLRHRDFFVSRTDH